MNGVGKGEPTAANKCNSFVVHCSQTNVFVLESELAMAARARMDDVLCELLTILVHFARDHFNMQPNDMHFI